MLRPRVNISKAPKTAWSSKGLQFEAALVADIGSNHYPYPLMAIIPEQLTQMGHSKVHKGPVDN